MVAALTGLAGDFTAGLALAMGLALALTAGLVAGLVADLAVDLEALTDLADLDALDADALPPFLAGDLAAGFLLGLVAMTIL